MMEIQPPRSTLKMRVGDVFTASVVPHRPWWAFWRSRKPVLRSFRVTEVVSPMVTGRMFEELPDQRGHNA